jgi:hypothetical protein
MTGRRGVQTLRPCAGPARAPNITFDRTAGSHSLAAAGQRGRVCQAWHRTNGVQVPVPGVSGAEGEEKGKGAAARWRLKEA